MTEKYKIYLPSTIKDSLTADAELFEFYKKNQDINLNAFLKCVIENYFEDYREKTEEIHNNVAEVVKTRVTTIEELDLEYISAKVLEMIVDMKYDHVDRTEGFTITVSGRVLEIIEYIQENLLKQMSLSEYIRNMFLSYLMMPRSEREKIIFRDQYNEIMKAIKEKRQLTFSIIVDINQKSNFIVNPYEIAASKQEQNNYLLCYDCENKKVRSFRLSRLRNVFLKANSFIPDNEVAGKIQLAIKKGPQFSFDSIERACVVLSDEGKRKFRMIYTNRPTIEKIEGDRYYFDWPLIQLEEYFRRFGKDAIIISPEISKENMRKFYSMADNAYSDIPSVDFL